MKVIQRLNLKLEETIPGLKKFFKNLFIFFLLFFTINSFAQERSKLEKEKADNVSKIKYTKNLLDQTKSIKSSSLHQLNLLSEGIRYREQLVKNLENEAEILESEVLSIENDLRDNVIQMDNLKKEYAEIIRKSYRNQGEDYVWMYILSSQDINQAYQRIKYIKYLNNYRRLTADRILATDDSLLDKRLLLEKSMILKKEAISKLNDEHKQLEKDVDARNITLKELKKKEGELLKELKKREQIQKQLEAEIRKVIEEEARKAKAENKVIRLTPEEKLISDNFVTNKGRLPWPTEQGVITGRFGQHNHPVLPGIKISSDGIDISTGNLANVRTVFDGEVTKVIAILGANYSVIVKHGNYRTVYMNLVDVKVKAGDKLLTKEYIGKVKAVDGQDCRVHFQVWKESEPQNPELWLSR